MKVVQREQRNIPESISEGRPPVKTLNKRGRELLRRHIKGRFRREDRVSRIRVAKSFQKVGFSDARGPADVERAHEIWLFGDDFDDLMRGAVRRADDEGRQGRKSASLNVSRRFDSRPGLSGGLNEVVPLGVARDDGFGEEIALRGPLHGAFRTTSFCGNLRSVERALRSRSFSEISDGAER